MNRIAYALIFGLAGLIALGWFFASMIAPHPGLASFLGVVFQTISTIALIKFMTMREEYRFQVQLPQEPRNVRSSRQAVH